MLLPSANKLPTIQEYDIILELLVSNIVLDFWFTNLKQNNTSTNLHFDSIELFV